MQTWKLEIQYEGTRYRGWQRQENARSVQGELYKAAEEIFQQEVEIGGAGRTDAGVHAWQQFAHLRVKELKRDYTPKQVQFALNDLLPHDINIVRAYNSTPNFNARYDAVSRFYLYQISTRRTAFAKNFVWWIKDRLDFAAMNHATKLLLGKHDFYSFCDPPTEAVSTLVTINKAQLFTHGDMILFRIGAGHFLWKMVRRIVGTLAEVGRGNLGIKEFERLMKRKSRQPAAWTAPPSGLFLEKVLYTGDEPPEKLEPLFSI
jgi:tRNA pseudouridine38-40 synthase